jgi:uncharacterized iron-regulated membrane protein
MTIVIVIALIAVLAALFSAGLFMLRRPRDGADPARAPDKRMARALALLAWQLGWIAPKGLPTGR